MKLIIGILITFLIFYIAWQFIKRAIFIKIFKNLNNFPHNNQSYEEPISQKKMKNREFKKDIKWDAETIEYEEIPNQK